LIFGVGVVQPAMAWAAIFTEGVDQSGDAGETLAGAHDTTGMSGLTAIKGELVLTLDGRDIDIFKIEIESPSHFSARLFIDETTGPADTYLFLFDAAGVGVIADDTSASYPDNPLSEIPTGSLPASALPGDYYIAVTAGFSLFEERLPLDGNGTEIFDSDELFADLGAETVAPSSFLPLASWKLGDPDNFAPGTYTLELTLAQAQVIPEPSSLVTLSGFLALAALHCRLGRRRS
jgi:hypothetical protein